MAQKDSIIDYLAELPNFLTIFMFSFFLFAPSAILIEISASLGVEPADFAIVFTLLTLGLVLGQLTSNAYKFLSRINLVSVFFVFLLLATSAMFFIFSLYLFYALYFLAGYFLGVIFIKANEYILESRVNNRAKMFTIASSFFPLGAIVTPQVSVFLVANGIGWRYIYVISVALFAATLLMYQLVTRRRRYEYQPEDKDTLKKERGKKKKNIIFIITCLALFSYAIAETVISTWSPTFFRMIRDFDVYSAGNLLTIFWAAIIGGRLVSGYLTDRFETIKILFYISILGTASLLFYLFSSREPVIFLSIIFTGIGFSAIFPLLIFYGSTLYEKKANFILPALFISATLGNSAAPYLAGMTSRYSMIFSISLSLIFMGATIFLITALLGLNRKGVR